MAHIQTPVKGYTGKVAGVSFADGVGETEDPAALAYFERHGYDITTHGPPNQDEGKEPSPKEKLQAEAKALGLDDSGKVDELKARIAEHKNKPAGGTPVTDGEGNSNAGSVN